MKKLSIKLTQGTRASGSMKRVAQALTARVGYKVFRTQRLMPKKRQLGYGMGVDKIKQYEWFVANDVPALEFTTSKDAAQVWVDAGDTVVGRKLISASCGKGIVMFTDGRPVGPALPVYTKYKKKKREFRIHVFQDKVVAIVEKKQRKDWQGERDTHIRNLANGYVFCQDPVDLPVGIQDLAIKAARVVASDFKGVDIGYNEKKQELFVIEVNSAPGIEGQNVQKYVNAILG